MRSESHNKQDHEGTHHGETQSDYELSKVPISADT